jgi:hypothetical protein
VLQGPEPILILLRGILAKHKVAGSTPVARSLKGSQLQWVVSILFFLAVGADELVLDRLADQGLPIVSPASACCRSLRPTPTDAPPCGRQVSEALDCPKRGRPISARDKEATSIIRRRFDVAALLEGAGVGSFEALRRLLRRQLISRLLRA